MVGLLRRWVAVAMVGAGSLGFAATAEATFIQELGSPFAVGTDPGHVLVPDVNADGRPDALVVNGTSSNLSVLLRLPGGGFAPEVGSPIPLGAGPSFAARADFNVDGRPDIAVGSFAGGNSVTVLLRQAGGGFVPDTGSPIAIGAPVGAVGAGDFNADGRPDLAATSWDAGTVRIFLRLPDGGFAAEGPALATGTNPRYVAVADFNADGRSDLAITNFGSASVSVLLRQPGGGFTAEPGSPIAVGAQPMIAIADDLNADGRPDLALTSAGAGTVTILLRNAGGGFTPEAGSPIFVGGGPVGLASGDFDADGARDLAIAHGGANTVSVLLRRPGGGFAPDPSSPVPVATEPNAVAVADFDADGRADLAVTSAPNRLTVLLNTTPRPSPTPPPTPGPPTTPRRPRILDARLASSTVRARAGLRLRLRLDQAATLRATIKRRVRGRKVGRRCLPKAKRGRRCTISRTVRRQSFRARPAGPQRLRVRTRALKPGTYTLTLRATAGNLTSRPVTLRFRVIKPQQRKKPRRQPRTARAAG